MKATATIHGRLCTRKGRRFYAVDKATNTIVDKLAARSASGVLNNPFDKVLLHGGRNMHAHVIRNIK